MAMQLDMFPSDFSSQFVDTLEIHKKEYNQCNFDPFVPHLYEGEIHFKSIPGTFDTIKNLKLTVKKSHSDKPRNIITWKNVTERLKNDVHEENSYKNQDPRLAFRKGLNIFVTKSLFTFGLRHTAPGECHIYETHKQPLLIFIPFYGMRHYRPAKFPFDPEGCDSINNSYDRSSVYIMKSETRYILKENTYYLILTTQRSVFAVYKFRNQDVNQSEFNELTCACPEYLFDCGMRSFKFSGSALSAIHNYLVLNSESLEGNQLPIRTGENKPAVDGTETSGNDVLQPPAKRFRSSSSSRNSFTNAPRGTDFNSDNSQASVNILPNDDEDRNGRVEADLPSDIGGQTVVTEERMKSSNISDGVINGNLRPNTSHSSDININKPSTSSATALEDRYGDFSAIRSEIINHSTPKKSAAQGMLLPTDTIVQEPSVPLNSSLSTQSETQEGDTAVPETLNRELSSNPEIDSLSNSTSVEASNSRIPLNQSDLSIQNEPAPFKITDESGNEYLYNPINLNWKESVSGPLLLHPFVKYINGNAWAFVPIKIKDAV